MSPNLLTYKRYIEVYSGIVLAEVRMYFYNSGGKAVILLYKDRLKAYLDSLSEEDIEEINAWHKSAVEAKGEPNLICFKHNKWMLTMGVLPEGTWEKSIPSMKFATEVSLDVSFSINNVTMP